jgi:hypothetical protein
MASRPAIRHGSRRRSARRERPAERRERRPRATRLIASALACAVGSAICGGARRRSVHRVTAEPQAPNSSRPGSCTAKHSHVVAETRRRGVLPSAAINDLRIAARAPDRTRRGKRLRAGPGCAGGNSLAERGGSLTSGRRGRIVHAMIQRESQNHSRRRTSGTSFGRWHRRNAESSTVRSIKCTSGTDVAITVESVPLLAPIEPLTLCARCLRIVMCKHHLHSGNREDVEWCRRAHQPVRIDGILLSSTPPLASRRTSID